MTVVLETERLFLRELLLNDIEPLAALLANRDVTAHIGGAWDPPAVRRFIHEQQSSYHDRGYGHWALIHRESAILVGHAGLGGVPPKLGCVIDPLYWRRGLAKEILTAVRDHAFSALELEAVTAAVHPKNKAGKKLAEALGMRLDSEPDKRVELVYVAAREDR